MFVLLPLIAFGINHLPQALLGATQLSAYVGGRFFHNAGNLCDGKVLRVVEKYGRALRDGQLGHMSPKVVVLLDRDGALAQLGFVGHQLLESVRCCGVDQLDCHVLSAAKHVAAGVARHGDEPVAQVSVVGELLVALVQLDECLLSDVPSRLKGVQHTAGGAEHEVLIGVHGLLYEVAAFQFLTSFDCFGHPDLADASFTSLRAPYYQLRLRSLKRNRNRK